jgi:hypothetical protein
LAVLFFFSSIYSQELDNEMNELMNTNDYLKLKRRYETAKDSMQIVPLKLMIELFQNAAFNKLDKSNANARELLENHQESLGLHGIAAVVFALSDNHKRQGNFQTSSEVVKPFLDYVLTLEGGPDLDMIVKNLKNRLPMGVFGNGFKPVIVRPDRDCEISYHDGDGKLENLMYVDANLNGNDVSFVFDTGADGFDTNTVSEGFARRNGIRILGDSVVITGTADGSVRLGIADSMQIGDITYKNVGFTVAPGDNLLPVDTLFLEAILGSVFMKAMGEFQIYPKEKKIVFPKDESPMPAGGSNMFFQTGQPYVEAFSKDERLLLHFDTGGGVALSSKYYLEHKDEVEATGRLYTEGGVGGFGAMIRMDQYILPVFPLRIGDKEKEFKEVRIMTDIDNLNLGDGGIGADFVRRFDKVTVNYNKMFVKFE